MINNLLSKSNTVLFVFVILAMPILYMSYSEIFSSIVFTGHQWKIAITLLMAGLFAWVFNFVWLGVSKHI